MGKIDTRNFRRGTPEYNEITRFLGRERCRQIADESIHQISGRWLKGSFFVTDKNGDLVLTEDGLGIVTRRRRIRIPRDSSLARGRRSRCRSV